MAATLSNISATLQLILSLGMTKLLALSQTQNLSPQFTLAKNQPHSLTFAAIPASGAQINAVAYVEGTLSQNGTLNVALSSITSSGSSANGANGLGDTVAFAAVKGYALFNTSNELTVASLGKINIKPASSNPILLDMPGGNAGGGVDVEAGQVHLKTNDGATGWAVASGSADSITITNNSGTAITASYLLVVWGVSA